jgi:hypothetical protein
VSGWWLRAIGALIAVVLATLLLSNYLQEYWVRAFAASVNAPESGWRWWSPAWLAMTWGWNVLVTFVASLALAVMSPGSSKIGWYIGLGLVFAVLRFLSEGAFRGSGADAGFTLWQYGSYVALVAGATLGGIAAIALGPRLRRVVGGRDAR